MAAFKDQNLEDMRRADNNGSLNKFYIRKDILDRIIERIAAKEAIVVGGVALKYTAGYSDEETHELVAEKWELTEWTQTHEDTVNGITGDGTIL